MTREEIALNIACEHIRFLTESLGDWGIIRQAPSCQKRMGATLK